MNPSEFPTGERQSPRRQLQIQGHRPPPLSVHKESHKIRKPPKPPAQRDHPQPAAASSSNLRQQPLVIYDVSPKVVHVTPSDFMSVVQRLTGISTSVFSEGDVSPAARLAATEKASPRFQRDGKCDGAKEDPTMAIVNDGIGAAESNQSTDYVPAGILSPSPEMIPGVATGFFSPAGDESSLPSPFFLANNNFATSPVFQSNNSLISPMFSPTDIFGHFWNF